MHVFRFRKFRVYQDCLRFRTEVKKLVKDFFPNSEQYNLSDQILRAVTSVVLNIAEGSDRSTDKDFALFLNRSLTSINEVVACLDIALDENYITTDLHAKHLTEAAQLADQVTAFRQKLLRDNQVK